MTARTPPSFEIVPRRGWFARTVFGLALLLLGALIGGGLFWVFEVPPPGDPRAALAERNRRLREQAQVLEELQQQATTLRRSDQISREANADLQAMLAEKEEEIAGLRADVAFYERFVGSSGPRKGLSVHSAEFAPEVGGSWRYEVVLTQSLNRGAMTQGMLRFAVDGVRNGQLTTVNWDELHQKANAPPQDYDFRYFQRLGGSVILPAGFTPQRVRISLRGSGAAVDQTVAWTVMKSPGEA